MYDDVIAAPAGANNGDGPGENNQPAPAAEDVGAIAPNNAILNNVPTGRKHQVYVGNLTWVSSTTHFNLSLFGGILNDSNTIVLIVLTCVESTFKQCQCSNIKYHCAKVYLYYFSLNLLHFPVLGAHFTLVTVHSELQTCILYCRHSFFRTFTLQNSHSASLV